MRHTTLLEYLVIVAIGAVLYVGIASTIFAFRHPWATQTQRLLCLPEAVALEKVEKGECG